MKSSIGYTLMTLFAACIAGCAPSSSNNPTQTGSQAAPAKASSVVSAARTQGASGETESAVIMPGSNPGTATLIAAAGPHGLDTYALDGTRQTTISGSTASAIAISHGYMLAGKPATLLATITENGNSLRLWTMHEGAPVVAQTQGLALDFSVEGVCLLRNPTDGIMYVLVTGSHGQIDQRMIYTGTDGKLSTREVRRIHLPSKLKQCVADHDGHVYVAQAETGIWRFNADPESDLGATVVDAPRLGHLTGEAEGLALYDGGAGSRWLLASLSSDGRINVYDREHDNAYLGSFTIAAGAHGPAVDEPGQLFATSMAMGKNYPHGILVVGADDDADFRLLSMADVAAALGLDPGVPQDPRQVSKPPVPTVTARVETTPVQSPGDAADDPAIWANPQNPAKSLIVGTDKKAGMYVYDMHGKVLQFRADGRMNNTDLRSGFSLDGHDTVLVTASDRTHDAIAIYSLDTSKAQLHDVANGLQKANLGDPYGLCMYRNPDSGKTYVFINTGSGLMRQWELVADHGRVEAHKVREFKFSTQVEGCDADDASGQLFVDEEDKALWKLSAKADGGDKMTAIDRVGDNPALKDDLEGLGIYNLGNGRGYIVISVQGNDTYAVYRLEGKHDYLGSFAVIADGARGIDGISQTDGLDITSRNLGPGFEHGAMIAQDGRNVLPQENQNYKYVSWDDIAKALDLEVRKAQP